MTIHTDGFLLSVIFSPGGASWEKPGDEREKRAAIINILGIIE
jgi:hypothetical protein